jgi:hypothetical protein
VTKSVPSGASTTRLPKCSQAITAGSWRNSTRTSESASPASESRATASTVRVRYSSAGSASPQVRKTSRLVATSRAATTSMSPPWPSSRKAGRPATAVRVPSAPMCQSRPARSVTSIAPSGRKATAQGWRNGPATGSARTGPAALLAATGAGASAAAAGVARPRTQSPSAVASPASPALTVAPAIARARRRRSRHRPHPLPAHSAVRRRSTARLASRSSTTTSKASAKRALPRSTQPASPLQSARYWIGLSST